MKNRVLKNTLNFVFFSIAILFANTGFCQPNRNWGTLYGGLGYEQVHSIATDSQGNVYMVGQTNSTSSMTTLGSHQPNFGGSYDAFLVKFDSLGVRQWATYYGGTGNEAYAQVALDASGNIYLAGQTSSTNNISTFGCHQFGYGGGTYDGFLVKFNSAGVRQWGTYYGGKTWDYVASVCIDDISGNIYIVGASDSPDSIATPGSHQPVYGGSVNDGYLAQFNSSGVRQWGTYYGGPGSDYATSVVVDNSGNINFTGYSNSTSGISTPTSQQPINSGQYDIILVQFSISGVRQWGTYIGGVSTDYGYSVAVDKTNGNICVGAAVGSSGMGTSGAHQQIFGGSSDAFLAQYTDYGARLWSTYYGGAGIESGFSVAIAKNSDIYFGGQTNTAIILSTSGSHQPNYGGGTNDAFLAKFNSIGKREWGTYYGGNGNELDRAMAIDTFANVYLAGYTTYTAGLTTPGCHQSTYGGGSFDGFLARFNNNCNVAPTQPVSISGFTSVCVGAGASTYSIAQVQGATSYTWTLAGGWTGSSSTNTIFATPGSSAIFSVVASNACGASSAQTLSVTVNPIPTLMVSTNSTLLCVGQTATLTSAGANTYTWNPGGTGSSIIVSPTITATYTITGIDVNGCVDSSVFTQSVSACTGIKLLFQQNAVITLYPNPNNGTFKFKINSEILSGEIIIFNSIGQKVHEQKVTQGDNNIITIGLSQGLYHYMFLENKQLLYSGEFVIE